LGRAAAAPSRASSEPRVITRLALVALLAPAVAAADKYYGGDQATPEFGENAPRNYQSSQYFAFELKFGPYSPDIDASPGLNGRTPFADLFNPQGKKGRPDSRLLTSVELDVQFLKKFGTLGFGTSIGYYRRTTHSFQYPAGTDPNTAAVSCTVPNCVRSGDETALNILPLEGMLVYRFDVLANRYHIPFVPYVKVGLAYYIWWIENGGGFLSVSSFTNPQTKHKDDGYGGTFGWVLNPGLAFQLDVLDPSAARTIDSELGINHSYIFCELHWANIEGFGANDKLELSDLTLNAGLAFEF
jgi:hypothetical protein